MTNDLNLEDMFENEQEEGYYSSSIIDLTNIQTIFNESHLKIFKHDNKYHVFIFGTILAPTMYAPLLLLLATECCKINIYINSSGGSVATAVQIIHAIQSSISDITTIVDGECLSVAAIIALSADNIDIREHSIMMFHDTSGGVLDGKTSAVAHQQLCLIKHYKYLLEKITKNFLTKKEIKDIFNGKDLYISGEDMQKRLNKL